MIVLSLQPITSAKCVEQPRARAQRGHHEARLPLIAASSLRTTQTSAYVSTPALNWMLDPDMLKVSFTSEYVSGMTRSAAGAIFVSIAPTASPIRPAEIWMR